LWKKAIKKRFKPTKLAEWKGNMKTKQYVAGVLNKINDFSELIKNVS
jgi:hypothetical protein